MKKTRTLSVIIIFLLIIISGLLFIQKLQLDKTGPFTSEYQDHAGKVSHLENKSWKSTATLAAVGDILIHDRVYNVAVTNHGYDFKPMLKHVKHQLLQPDILLANQETLLGGMEIGLSTYPCFNSPQEVGDALIDSGVDIVTTANNHTLDRGEKAILSAIRYYEKMGLPYVGHFKDWEDQQKLRVLTTNGIKVAYLSYTYGTNGIPIPKGKEFLVNIIDQQKMTEEIHRAKEVADVIVMSLHWGNEYQRFPTKEQKELAQYLADEGVDVIFGHHSHVLQPMEMITTKDGRDVFIIYSLGNFLSGQKSDYKDIGGMVSVEVTKQMDNDGVSVYIDQPQFFPTYVSSTNNYQVVPLESAADYGLDNVQAIYREMMAHMFQWLDAD